VSDPKITRADVDAFAERKVDLPASIAREKRAQVNTLRDRLEERIKQDPGFALVKMRHAGSVAKGTALRTFNDFDVAVYVRVGATPIDEDRLVPWLVERLREAYQGLIDPSQVEPGPHCATITFKGSGTAVDVVPVLYEGEPQDIGGRAGGVLRVRRAQRTARADRVHRLHAGRETAGQRRRAD
jgi:tRNA nucleotidyltransferase (CCA-adding enzyme)